MGIQENRINKKEIIFKISGFPHVSETFIIAQIIAAIKAGFKVKILIVTLNSIEKTTHENIIKEHNLLDYLIFENYNIPKNKGIRFLKWIFILLFNVNNIRSIIRFYNTYSYFSLTYLYQWKFYQQFNNNHSIVHIQYGNNQGPIGNLKETGYFKPPVILTFHGHDAFFPMHGYIPNNGYYDKIFQFGDIITANTKYLADKVLELGCPREKMLIMPVGVDNRFFSGESKVIKSEKKLKLITVGRLDKVKGHGYGIKIAKMLLEEGYDITLTIIGEGEEYKNLIQLVKDLHIENKVFLVGKKSQEEIREYLLAHHVYLFTGVPLEDGRRETQGLATLEAQACGLPAIVFDTGGVKYTVENNKSGFICAEYDMDDVVEKIKLLFDNELREKMSQYAVTFVADNFSQDSINLKWDLVYNKLL